MDRHRVAIIIPAYNEEKTILDVINSTSPYGQVILINDASTDNTYLIAKQTNALIINNKSNVGYDEALSLGFEKASKLGYDFVITFDADGQHDKNLLKEFVKFLKLGFPLVLGVRDKKSRVSEKIFSFYSKYAYNISDPLCGIKGYSLKLYQSIGYFDSYKSIGTELTLASVCRGKNFKEIKFNIKERSDSPRIGNLFYVNLIILRSMFRWIFFKRKYYKKLRNF